MPSVPRHALTGPLEHGRATGRNDSGVLNLADANVTQICRGYNDHDMSV